VYFSLAWCYKRTGQLPRAIEAMRTAHRLEPREGLAKYNLACYLSLAGKADEAIRWLGRAIVSDPEMRKMAATERDFDPIRHHPHFEELIGHPSSVPDDVA
jgi:tetratricopeptide (TPR) repeat protein